MGRQSEIPRLAGVTLTTLTPVHIGAGLSLVWDGAGRRWEGCQQVLVMTLPGGQAEPYIPGSTVRGLLRAMYACSQEDTSAGSRSKVMREADRVADRLLGSTSEAGCIAFSDLHAGKHVEVQDGALARYYPASKGRRVRRRGQRPFRVQLIPAGAVFEGEASYIPIEVEPGRREESLAYLLSEVFRRQGRLEGMLRSGSDGRWNPEMIIPGSPIGGTLFGHRGDRWSITWKIGRYAKSYAKALSTERRLRDGAPHAYYLVEGTNEVPGWVRITFELGAGDREFRLNEWP